MNRFLSVFSLGLVAVLACSTGDPAKPNAGPVVEPGPAPGEEPGNTDPNVTDPSPTDSGVADSSKDSDAGPKAPTNQKECIAACEAAAPTAAAQNHDLDNLCFFGTCGAVCNNLGQGESKYPDGASALACDTAAAGSYPIGTPSQACSNCLASTPACCTLWIAIFGSAEGQGLSKCAHDCWANFPQ
jgi:hypothetical protein